MQEMKAAVAASHWAVVTGTRPPPIRSMPPAAVMPEIAFVTDMSGECSAGVTLHTKLKQLKKGR